MGRIYYMTCRNKACGYRVEIREGSGMGLFRQKKNLEEKILKDEIEVPEEIKNLLKSGCELNNVATYLCPACREWQVENEPYILERTKVSPLRNGQRLQITLPSWKTKMQEMRRRTGVYS